MYERDLIIFQRNLRKGTSVKITNPLNSKTIIAKVGKKANYPSFNNSVVSIRISKELEIDINEPYIVIEEIRDNTSFIAMVYRNVYEALHSATNFLIKYDFNRRKKSSSRT